ncbi:hypothetical protein Landi51_05649 [Colletotrichum acutatum]
MSTLVAVAQWITSSHQHSAISPRQPRAGRMAPRLDRRLRHRVGRLEGGTGPIAAPALRFHPCLHSILCLNTRRDKPATPSRPQISGGANQPNQPCLFPQQEAEPEAIDFLSIYLFGNRFGLLHSTAPDNLDPKTNAPDGNLQLPLRPVPDSSTFGSRWGRGAIRLPPSATLLLSLF